MEHEDRRPFDKDTQVFEPMHRSDNIVDGYRNPQALLHRVLFRKDCLDRQLERHHITGPYIISQSRPCCKTYSS